MRFETEYKNSTAITVIWSSHTGGISGKPHVWYTVPVYVCVTCINLLLITLGGGKSIKFNFTSYACHYLAYCISPR
jgi:hypothetical protein